MGVDVRSDLATRLHVLAAALPRHDWRFDEHSLPASGIYVMFEAGEEIAVDGQRLPRIVRVGSHRTNGRLAHRIRANFGTPHARLPKHQPALRGHYRRALLSRDDRVIDPEDEPDRRFEERVTGLMRDTFSFAVIPVADAEERSELERGVIALLAQHPAGRPSKGWLGHCAEHGIARSGLWNVKHLGARALDPGQFARLERYAAASFEPGAGTPADPGESRRAAEMLLAGGLGWLRSTYAHHDFVTKRDLVWTLHKRLTSVARRTLTGFEVLSAVRDPEHRSRPLDLAVLGVDGSVVLAANVLYEPSAERRQTDLRYANLPYTSWQEVSHEFARVRQTARRGGPAVACAVLIDEGGRYTSRSLPDAVSERWTLPSFPLLTVTYATSDSE